MSATESNTKRLGFLPNLCSFKSILSVAIAAEVLAMVLALAAAAETYQASLLKLALTSLFVQWVVISSTMSLCLYNRFSSTKDVMRVALVTASFVAFFTICASVLTIMADSYQKVGEIFYWDTPFILRNLFISIVITLLTLRYFYIQNERDEHVKADSGAKYDALQSRMRPHFLFNSLNSIAMLVHQDADQAEEAILDLADIFRTTLDKRNRIPLREELDVTLRYLRMEGLRLGKRRLNIVWDMDRNTLPFEMMIPPLLLQPLAENAIYHGIQPREEGGTLGISLYDAGDKLDIVITNPVPPEGTNSHQKGNHIAQENLKNRLKLAYGNKANLQIKRSRHQYRVSFSIPKE
ncbi:sensor histidine kinase [Leucothrix arctica]|uniref:Histidine kinase n=1 Tax=Leucothrix arctica TaxID=1481894 RepID=A0A317CDT5_9GAMM|nr:histidine kinase [Leucothrix arctica]PWQ96696.1 histidine kinase [Leucothrix arctica]